MIVCICRGLNDRAVREAAENGAASPEAVMRAHGQRFQCGSCRECMCDIIAETSGQTANAFAE